MILPRHYAFNEGFRDVLRKISSQILQIRAEGENFVTVTRNLSQDIEKTQVKGIVPW